MHSVDVIRLLLVLAFFFQIVGVGLVVQELRRTSKLTSSLSQRLTEITNVWHTADEDAEAQVREELDDDGIIAPIAAVTLAIDRRVRLVDLSVRAIADYSTKVNETSRIVAVAGPSCLALGIVLGFVAGMAATL